MPLHIYNTTEEMSRSAAQWTADYIGLVLQQQDRFTIALSGGGTPKRLHELLAASPYKERIDWSRLHVFWGDERAVPFNDDRNNAKMAYDTLLDHVPVPASQIHIMRTDISPEQSAVEYEKMLRQYFSGDAQASGFDLVFLGMGDDGHTLSLFPGTPVVHEEKLWATSFFLQAQDMYRITLTRSIVNRAARIAFLVTGPGKAVALQAVLEGAYNPDRYPSQVIRPVHGELHWFLDKAAAANLK